MQTYKCTSVFICVENKNLFEGREGGGGRTILGHSGRSKIYMYTKEQKEHALKEYVRTPECEKSL